MMPAFHRPYLLPILLACTLSPAVARDAKDAAVLNDTALTRCRAPDGTFSRACAGTGQDGEFGRPTPWRSDIQRNPIENQGTNVSNNMARNSAAMCGHTRGIATSGETRPMAQAA